MPKPSDALVMVAAAGLVVGAAFLWSRRAQAAPAAPRWIFTGGGTDTDMGGSPLVRYQRWWSSVQPTAPIDYDPYLSGMAQAEAEWAAKNPPVQGWTVG